MTIIAARRPFTLTFSSTGHSYPMTADETQRLLDNYPALLATKHRVVLRADDGTRGTLRPATLGGGPAFTITR
jgi:hypothetical protein